MKCDKTQDEIMAYTARLKGKVLNRLDCQNDIDDKQVLQWIDEVILEESKECYIPIVLRQILRQNLFNSLRKLDILQELLENEAVTEIMINGTEGIFYEKEGTLYKWDKRFEKKERLEEVIQQIVSKTNRIVNESSPIVDTRLENGARVNVVLNPIAINGPIVTIRRFPDEPITMEKLLEYGTLDEDTALFLKQLVECRYNIFISGGTGCGKTTFLNVLSDYIPSGERVITIEDTAELQIRNVENLVKLEMRSANTEGKNEITMRDLIKTALRMRCSRLVVGEVRGAECVELMSAYNTGHDGTMSTGHSNSATDMLSRLEMMILMGLDIPLEAVRRQIVTGIDIIVHLGRMRDRSRKLLEIIELEGFENGTFVLNPLVVFREDGFENGKIKGHFERCGKLKNRQKLKGAWNEE